MRHVTIIAEIGTSHGGDLEKAKELVLAAKEAGADCAKLQMVFADEIVHPLTGDVQLPGGAVPLFERFKSLEAPPEFYAAVKTYCESIGIEFLCSAFGVRSARILKSLGVGRMKIASPELNHVPLLREVARFNMPVILSTGVSTLGDIENAIAIVGVNRALLLHCITAYPAPDEQYNITLIPRLAGIFGVPVGVSDHSLDPVLVPSLSVVNGAVIIEKHFTLSRADGGLDDPIAQEPTQFARMCATVRRIEQIVAIDPTNGPDKVIKEFAEEFGAERIESILGTGVKSLAAAESPNYLTTNRSIHALRTIEKGAVIRAEDIAVLRSEKKLRPGIRPEFFDVIVGRTATRDIPNGEGITFDDVMSRVSE